SGRVRDTRDDRDGAKGSQPARRGAGRLLLDGVARRRGDGGARSPARSKRDLQRVRRRAADTAAMALVIGENARRSTAANDPGLDVGPRRLEIRPPRTLTAAVDEKALGPHTLAADCAPDPRV